MNIHHSSINYTLTCQYYQQQITLNSILCHEMSKSLGLHVGEESVYVLSKL